MQLEVQENGQVLQVIEDCKVTQRTILAEYDAEGNEINPEKIVEDMDVTIIKIPYRGGEMERCTVLSYADGIVTAQVYNYLDEFQADYDGDIIFDCAGETESVQAIGGVATIPVEIDPDADPVTVRTVNERFRNGEVVVNAD